MNTIGDILQQREARQSSRVYYVQRGQTVASLCQYMASQDVGTVCVFDGARFVGVCSERDVVRRVVASGLDPQRVKVEDVMTTNLLVAHPAEDYRQCLDKMQRARVRHLPVVEEGNLVGMLSIRSLLDEQGTETKLQLQALTDYVYQLPPGS